MEMEADNVLDATSYQIYTDNANAEDVADNNSLDDFLFGKLFLEVQIARETLTRVGLDLACSLEKLTNLNILMMLVQMREIDSFTSEQVLISTSSFSQALEVDLLTGILESELREIDDFMLSVNTGIVYVRKFISSHNHLGAVVLEMEVELDNAEESMKQSYDALSELKMQSSNLHSSLSKFSGEENWKSHRGEVLNGKADIRMQTSEQKRNVLKMLDKSLAAELDLLKKLDNSSQTEEELKSLLRSSKQEVLFLEQEVALIRESLFEAENSAEVLMGLIKEILGSQQIINFYLNSSTRSEDIMRSKHHDSEELQPPSFCADFRAHDAAVNCKLQNETEFHGSDFQLRTALASAEKIQEKQSMLYTTICCMQSLIEDLRSRVSKAESRAEKAEDNCNILSVCNAKLNGELSFIRIRLEYMEASLHQAKDTTSEAAKEINIRTNMIATLVMQLSLERERLFKQILSLREENRILRQQDEGRVLAEDSVSTASGAKQSKGEENNDISATEIEGEPELGVEDSATNLVAARNIGTRRQLSFRHFLMALAISASAALWFRLPQGHSS